MLEEIKNKFKINNNLLAYILNYSHSYIKKIIDGELELTENIMCRLNVWGFISYKICVYDDDFEWSDFTKTDLTFIKSYRHSLRRDIIDSAVERKDREFIYGNSKYSKRQLDYNFKQLCFSNILIELETGYKFNEEFRKSYNKTKQGEKLCQIEKKI